MPPFSHPSRDGKGYRSYTAAALPFPLRRFASPGNHCIRKPGYRLRMEHLYYGTTASVDVATAHKFPGFLFLSAFRPETGKVNSFLSYPAAAAAAHATRNVIVGPPILLLLPIVSFLGAQRGSFGKSCVAGWSGPTPLPSLPVFP